MKRINGIIIKQRTKRWKRRDANVKSKIIKYDNGWYKDEIGNVFDVDDKLVKIIDHLSFSVIQNWIPTALCIRVFFILGVIVFYGLIIYVALWLVYLTMKYKKKKHVKN